MKSMYNYKSNITVTTTVNGDKVITMNKEIFTELLNDLFEAHDSYEKRHLNSLAETTITLWQALRGKSDDSEQRIKSDFSDIKFAISQHDNLTDAERAELINTLKGDYNE